MDRRGTEARLKAAVARVAAVEASIKAFAHIDPDAAPPLLEGAGRTRPLLEGVVVGVKDVIDVAGMPTRFGSRAFAEAGAAECDAEIVARLRAAGAILLGKTRTTEFAYTDPTVTDNPAMPGHTPGGSSSGSAAAVAAGMADLCLGTQTVGSVCRPAAFCGVPAFKPSTGSTPLAGISALSPLFDTVGYIARDMQLAVAGWTAGRTPANAAAPLSPPVASANPARRIARLDDGFFAETDPDVRAALESATELMRKDGSEIVHITTGVDHAALREDHRLVMFHDAACENAALLSRPELLGPNWRRALETGRTISRAEREAALDRLRDARARLCDAAAAVDALLVPPARTTAPAGHGSTGDAALIVSWTVMGGPIAVLPCAAAQNGAPTAVMLTTLPGQDSALAALALRFEETGKHLHDRHP